MSDDSPKRSESTSTLQSIASEVSRSRSSKTNTLKPEEATKGLEQEHIARLTEDACRKLAACTRAELLTTVEDCQLLETMNKMTKDKYSEMSQMSQRLVGEMAKLQDTYADFSRFITQIDNISEQAKQMESTAKALDDYSRHLEAKLIESQQR